MALKVSCTEKDHAQEAHGQVKGVGGVSRDGTPWKRDASAVIAEIESGEQTYYVNVDGRTPNLQVATHRGVKYLTTQLDREGAGMLLGLPDC
ncbi:MAG: DUF3892 domain-containing protein [Alphaproteobacteria bacterium]|nr:DUF3892 domain-containing protein [Alphaproteobacteria bacterium]